MPEYVTHPIRLIYARRYAALGERPRRGERHERQTGGYGAGSQPAPLPRTTAGLLASGLKPGQSARHIRLPLTVRPERRQTFFHPLFLIAVHIV